MTQHDRTKHALLCPVSLLLSKLDPLFVGQTKSFIRRLETLLFKREGSGNCLFVRGGERVAG